MIDSVINEKRTVSAMIDLYCREKHHSGELCDSCAALKEYAFHRLERCAFRGRKPACSRCPVHCYRPEARRAIQEVMRFSGPRMALSHPFMAFRHLLVVAISAFRIGRRQARS